MSLLFPVQTLWTEVNVTELLYTEYKSGLHIPCTPCIGLPRCLDQAYILVLWEALIRKVPKIIKRLSRQPKKRIHHIRQWPEVWAEKGRSHGTWIHLCFQSVHKISTSETGENIQKKTLAFKFSRPDSKTCSELSDLQIQPSHGKDRKQLKQPFKSFLPDMAQIDPQIPWDVLLETNQKCKTYFLKIVYILCKIDFFPFNTKICSICWENKIF